MGTADWPLCERLAEVCAAHAYTFCRGERGEVISPHATENRDQHNRDILPFSQSAHGKLASYISKGQNERETTSPFYRYGQISRFRNR
jgi:hypothetical protein